jgi:hypothetical protein
MNYIVFNRHRQLENYNIRKWEKKREILDCLAHTVAFAWSQEKYVVKKQGSFPSVTLYRGTWGDSPSRDPAFSMYFWGKFSNIRQEYQAK